MTEETIKHLNDLFEQRWSGRLTSDMCQKADEEIRLIQIKAQVRIAEALTKMAHPPMPISADWKGYGAT